MEKVKKDLIKDMDVEFSDNMSITTSNDEEENVLAGEAQSVHNTD